MEGVQERVSEKGMEGLKRKLDTILSIEDGSERIEALESLIASCAVPLESGETLSDEYAAFLTSLGRLHLAEEAREKLLQLSK